MAAVQYAQILDGTDAGQSAADDARWASTPLEVRKGIFRLHVIPRFGSDASGVFCMLQVRTASGALLTFALRALTESGDPAVYVECTGWGTRVVRECTWSAGQRLAFTFDARDGSVTVDGATTGDGKLADATWCFPDGAMRLGNTFAEDACFHGALSLPYAVIGEDPARAAAAPTITSVTPNHDGSGGGGGSTIAGTGFTKGTLFRVAADYGSSIVWVSSVEMTMINPSGSVGAHDLVVENANGTGTLAGGFTFTP